MIGSVVKWGLGLLGAHRSWLTLLLVGFVAAGLYGRYAHLQHQLTVVAGERDRAFEWRHRVCLVAGVNTKAKGFVKGDCQLAIAGLVKFKGDTLATTNTALAAGLEDGRRKAVADLARADAVATRLGQAAAAMENANAKVGADDRVGGDWFAAVNAVGGLRQPPRR